jgi:putative membrane protein
MNHMDYMDNYGYGMMGHGSVFFGLLFLIFIIVVAYLLIKWLIEQNKTREGKEKSALDIAKEGSVAKNLAPLQNQKKPSQLGYLIDFITDKITHKGKNYGLKLRKYYFCTRTAYYYLWFSFYSIVSLERIFCNGTPKVL